MPKATPELRRLRIEAVIKTGPFAELVEYNRNAYSNVEHGHRPASPEFFQRCADVLSEKLTDRRGSQVTITADVLYAQDDQVLAEERKIERDDQKPKSDDVSPTSLPPARPTDDPRRPPSKGLVQAGVA